MNDELWILIKEAQEKNKDATMKIIDKFIPLIKKYARILNYDGADTDLTISLIKLIKKMPVNENTQLQKEKVIVSYIAISIKNESIRLSQKHRRMSHEEIPCEDEIIDAFLSYDEKYDFIIEDLLKQLPEIQKTIIKGIFLLDFKEIELAKSLNISRQAVNKNKRRALANLKKYLS